MLLWFHHNSRIGFGIEEDNTAILNLEQRGFTEAYGSNGSATETDLERRMLDVWINMDKKMVALGDGMLGMAPRDAEVDNLVFILAGCNYPVVVRKTPVKESYKLVGECYVDGFMHGEAILQQSMSRWEMVRLC